MTLPLNMQYFFIAIASEMALNYNTGLTSRHGSPFTQARKQIINCKMPKDKKKALLWMDDYLREHDLEPTNYFTKTINKIKHELL